MTTGLMANSQVQPVSLTTISVDKDHDDESQSIIKVRIRNMPEYRTAACISQLNFYSAGHSQPGAVV